MEDIKNRNVYLTKMSKTFFDKAWFMSHIPEEIDTFIDFGCADGSFMKFLQSNCPSFKYFGIDNDPYFVRKTEENGFKCYTSLDDFFIKTNDFDRDRTCLILSSVLHEIYSYSNSTGFWNEVAKLNPKYIAIRDMMFIQKKQVSLEGIDYIFEKYFKKQFAEFKEIWKDEHDLDYTAEFFAHFMLKYIYNNENWKREVKENYLPLNEKMLINKSWMLGYEIDFKDHYKLPYLVNRWKTDFHLNFDHYYANNLKEFINSISTHVKILLRRNI
jgi:ribosomal protein L11 methylase PrmA